MPGNYKVGQSFPELSGVHHVLHISVYLSDGGTIPENRAFPILITVGLMLLVDGLEDSVAELHVGQSSVDGTCTMMAVHRLQMRNLQQFSTRVE